MIPEIDATYSLKTRPIRENKIEVMSENGGGLDANADLTNFFVQNIGDVIEIVVEKKVYQSKKEWGKCLQEMPVFIIREIENQRRSRIRKVEVKGRSRSRSRKGSSANRSWKEI